MEIPFLGYKPLTVIDCRYSSQTATKTLPVAAPFLTISLPLSLLHVVKFCRFPQLLYDTHKRVVFGQNFTDFYRILPLPQNYTIYPGVGPSERSK